MESQEIFNTVVNHLLQQNEVSKLAGKHPSCAYRSVTGLKCAIGCLISDEDYSLDFEGNSLRSLIEKNILPTHLSNRFSQNFKLLSRLQAIHDVSHPVRWKVSLQDLAVEYNLEFPEF